MFLNAYFVFFGGSDKVEISELTKSYIPRASIGAKKSHADCCCSGRGFNVQSLPVQAPQYFIDTIFTMLNFIRENNSPSTRLRESILCFHDVGKEKDKQDLSALQRKATQKFSS